MSISFIKVFNDMEFTQEESALLETLAKATSQNIDLIKSAEVKLKQWETEPGYYSTLLKIILNHSIDSTLRWLAASVLKTGINKYWRKAADNAIPEQEKAYLRSEVMNTFEEPVHAVAIQLAVLISRIARFDCPREWPELIPNLIEIIKNDSLLVQYRGLFTMNQVIKALASKTLAGDRKLFQLITSDIYPFMLSYWNVLFQNFVLQKTELKRFFISLIWNVYFNSDLHVPSMTSETFKRVLFFTQSRTYKKITKVRSSDPLCQGTLEKILLTLKILRKLTINGFKQPNESQDVTTFVNSLFDRIKDMFLFRKYGGKVSQLDELSEKIINNMTKVLLALLENHPHCFLLFIQPSLHFIRMYLFTEIEEHVLFEKFIIQCLNLMKAIILCPEYKMVKCKGYSYVENNSNQNQIFLEANRIKNEFFQTEVLEEICTKLVTHYFLLTRKDLQLWEDDPENFAFDDIGESWKFYLHPCTHSLYLALLREYKDVLTPLVLKLVRNNQQIVDPQDLNGILKKDAVYSSIGLCAFNFYDEVDFDQWFTTTLIHELGIKESNYRIIRRRVVWLIGKWTDVKPAVEIRPAICGAVIPLLHKDEDMVVRLTAAVALKSVVDSLEFTPDQFMGFLGPSFSMLFSLLQEVKECSTKMQILHVLSFIVGRVGEEIRPYSQSLIQYLPLLWEESADHNMLRCAIVSTLVQFVRGLVSENLTSFLYPVIECCTDVTNDAHIYLIEDGLELWFTVVEYSASLTPELFNLYKNMRVILEYTLEHLECCCNIIQAYILLSPERFLGECGESLMTLCSSLLTDVNDKGIEKIMQVVETAIKANPEIAIKTSFPILVYITLSVLEGEKWSIVVSMYLAIIGRVLLYSKDIFSEVLENAASTKSCRVEVLLEQILVVWNKMMPLVTQLEKRKLLALALSSLLTVQSNVVLSQFSAIVRNIVEALNDIMDIDCLSAELNSLMLVEDQSLLSEDVTDDDTKIERRKKQLNETDPVYKIELKGYLQSQFNDLRSQMGSSNFEGLIQTLDSEILQQCRMYIAV